MQILGQGDPTAGNSIFGFSTENSELDPATGRVDVPVFLDFENAESLQGVQATISWDVAELTVTDVLPGASVANAADWQLSFNEQGTSATVVLLGNDANALPESVYDPLFTFQFSLSTSSTSLQSQLTLDSAIGALAVPTGDDVGLVLGQASHTITLDPGDAVFSPDATELDAGTVLVDAAADVILTVTNTGNTDLLIDSIAVSNAVYAVTPGNSTVSPGDQQAFTITFAPTFTEFGVQEATLTFFHNAPGGSSAIQVDGLGIGGRGDASLDGAVDVLDLVLGIDYVLDITQPDPGPFTSMDLFPFGNPDGALDVRDLTVLSQAIVLDNWPDDLPLPVLPEGTAVNKQPQSGITLHAAFAPSGGTVVMKNEVPVRGLQVSLLMDSPAELPVLPAASDPAMTTQWVYDAWTSELRILAVRMDGGVLEPGSYPLLELPGYRKEQALVLTRGQAIVSGPVATAVSWIEGENTGLEDEDNRTPGFIGNPYPNPFMRSHSGHIHLPVVLAERQHVRAEVFNLLGQRVIQFANADLQAGEHVLSWDGLDQQANEVAPGVYLMRVQPGDQSIIRPVLIR